MKITLDGHFCELSQDELSSIDGGLFGVAWLTGALIAKVFAGGVTLGAAGASAYFASK